MNLFKGIENEENKDKKLSFVEKAVIVTLIIFAKLALRKISKAKTYGDLKTVFELIEDKFTSLDKANSDDLSDEEGLELLKKEFNNL